MAAGDPRWVVHIPVDADSEASALLIAELVSRELAHVQQVEALGVEVSPVDDQCDHRMPVFCNLLLPGGGRCGRRFAHPGRCAPAD